MRIVDFWAPWCAPCKVLRPRLHELDVELTEINADADIDACIAYRVRMLPTVIFFDGDQEVGRLVGGAANIARVEEFLREQLLDKDGNLYSDHSDGV